MAEETAAPASGRLTTLIQRFVEARGGAAIAKAPPRQQGPLPPVAGEEGWSGWIGDPLNLTFLQGNGYEAVRNRQTIYLKWASMQADPVISASLRYHVTAALGGHESQGQMVFIEVADGFEKDARAQKLVDMLRTDLTALLNKSVPTMAYNAVAFGDGYARIYGQPGVGIRDLYTDELVYPPLVQPYERANTTLGFEVSTGEKYREKLSILQMARVKMPRMMWVPQDRAIEKSIRTSLQTDVIEELPPVPAMAGGSFLDGAERPYDNLTAALASLIGTRARSSIDESIITVNLTQTTKEQRTKILSSLQAILTRSHEVFTQVMQSGRAARGKLFHVIPVNNEKQIARVEGQLGSGQAGEYNIEDVMMHARFLAGALGTDLSMLGFSDQLSGGLGDGGFTRTSIQTAERSRMIRSALTEAINHICEVHVLLKSSVDLHGQPLPWKITYFSGIAALEAERQKTEADRRASGSLLVQTMDQLKNLGLDEAAMAQFLQDEMAMDAKKAKAFAKALANAKPPEDAGGGFGGGGFGGPGGATQDEEGA